MSAFSNNKRCNDINCINIGLKLIRQDLDSIPKSETGKEFNSHLVLSTGNKLHKELIDIKLQHARLKCKAAEHNIEVVFSPARVAQLLNKRKSTARGYLIVYCLQELCLAR